MTRATIAIWLLILLPLGSEVGIGSLAFSGITQNIEINAETENESREETEMHILNSSQASCPKKRIPPTLKATYTTYTLSQLHASPHTLFKNTRVITYRSLLI